MTQSWSARVAPGVEIMRHRATHKLAYITQNDELDAAAKLIEEMAERLDAARYRAMLAAWVLTLFAVVFVVRLT